MRDVEWNGIGCSQGANGGWISPYPFVQPDDRVGQLVGRNEPFDPFDSRDEIRHRDVLIVVKNDSCVVVLAVKAGEIAIRS